MVVNLLYIVKILVNRYYCNKYLFICIKMVVYKFDGSLEAFKNFLVKESVFKVIVILKIRCKL